jgi:hypothetical protein
MANLQPFVDWFNTELGFDDPQNHTIGDAIAESFKRHFEKGEEYDNTPYIRASNLGKPAVLLALQQLGYTEPPMKGRVKFACYLGDVWESAVEVFLQTYGYKIVESQGEIEWNGITGHFDYIVHDGKQDLLVEAKCLSEGYSRMFSKEPNDDRGYLTQLALYSHRTNLPGIWLCFNKGTGEAFQVQPDEDVLQERLLRAENVINRIREVKSLADVLKNFRVPPPRPEIYKRVLTGKFLLPQSIAWSPFRSALYKLSDGLNGYNKMVKYVDEPADYDHMVNELQFLLENGTISKYDV